MAEVQSVRQLPPEFIEAASKTYIDDYKKQLVILKHKTYLKLWVDSLSLDPVH